MLVSPMTQISPSCGRGAEAVYCPSGPPQIPGLGGAVEIAPGNAQTAESTGALIPYNVNSQNIRQRVWDGQDKMLRDDVTWVKGNHLFQLGGLYQNNFNFHIRSDNGVGVNNQITYQVARQGIDWSSATGGQLGIRPVRHQVLQPVRE